MTCNPLEFPKLEIRWWKENCIRSVGWIFNLTCAKGSGYRVANQFENYWKGANYNNEFAL